MPESDTASSSVTEAPPPSKDQSRATDTSEETGEALRLYQAVIEETPLVIYAKDESARFLLSNRKHASLIGLPKERILGKTDAELFPEDSSAIDDTTKHVLDTGDPIFSEFPLPIGGEERIYHETIFRLHHDCGEVLGVGGIAVDITERRRLEAEVRQKQALLEAANRATQERALQLAASLEELKATRDALIAQEKMAALGSLVAGVAHEINTPLGVASMATDLLNESLNTLESNSKDSPETVQDLREATQLLRRNLSRASELVQSFKKVAVDQSSGEVRRTNLKDLCDDLHLTLRPLLQTHRVELSLNVAADLEALLQPGDLVQILTNLTDNACNHAFPAEQTERNIRLGIRTEGAALRLRFEDNGSGMSEPVSKQALEPFFTTARSKGNSGLGLAIVNNLVKLRFGGHIDLGRAEPNGCRIEILLQPGSFAFEKIVANTTPDCAP